MKASILEYVDYCLVEKVTSKCIYPFLLSFKPVRVNNTNNNDNSDNDNISTPDY